MSKKTCLHDGQNIYDTPRYGGSRCPVYPGYNGGCESYPTHGVGSAWKLTAYWEEFLFHRVLSVLEFEIPENWDRDFTLWLLFRCGYFAVIDGKSKDPHMPNFGIIPQNCGLAGQNVFYQPTRVTVANPLLAPMRRYIGKDAAVIKLTPGYDGAWGLIHYHAELLAEMSQALEMAILNSRLSHGYAADNAAAGQLLYTLMDCVDQGQPVVAVGKGQIPLTKDGKLPLFEINQDVGKNYIVDKLQMAIEKQLDEFDRAIGVPTMSDKKERQLTSEVQMTQNTALCAIDVWVDTLTRCIDQMHKIPMFANVKFSVTRPDYTEGSEANVNAD